MFTERKLNKVIGVCVSDLEESKLQQLSIFKSIREKCGETSVLRCVFATSAHSLCWEDILIQITLR